MCVYVCVDTDALFHPALLPPLISISCARARTPHTPLSHAHTREPKCMLLDDVIDKKIGDKQGLLHQPARVWGATRTSTLKSGWDRRLTLDMLQTHGGQ